MLKNNTLTCYSNRHEEVKMPNQNFNIHISIFLFILLIATPSPCNSKCLMGNCINGTGKATLAGVKTFEGIFANGKPEGSGIMTYSTGNIISGNFVGWNPVGKAILKCANGSEHKIDTSDNNSLSNKIKNACTVVVPRKIDPEYEAEIQRQLDRVSVYTRNMQIAEQINAQREMAHQPQQSITSPPSGSNNGGSSKINLEKRRLEAKYISASSRCKYGTKTCQQSTDERYRKNLSELNSDPDLYFYAREERQKSVDVHVWR
jgi:hypothetical protein